MTDYETNPILAAWKLLPPNVRDQYASGARSVAELVSELSPGAAVRDAVTASGEIGQGLLSLDPAKVGAGATGLGLAAAGLIPGQRLAVKSLDEVRKAWDAAKISHAVHENKDVITLSKIVVPKEERGKGIGTDAMQSLIDYADATGKRIALSPSSDFGGSKSRLVDFYKRFGFAPNKGRSKDYSISESMIRDARDGAE